MGQHQAFCGPQLRWNLHLFCKAALSQERRENQLVALDTICRCLNKDHETRRRFSQSCVNRSVQNCTRLILSTMKSLTCSSDLNLSRAVHHTTSLITRHVGTVLLSAPSYFSEVSLLTVLASSSSFFSVLPFSSSLSVSIRTVASLMRSREYSLRCSERERQLTHNTYFSKNVYLRLFSIFFFSEGGLARDMSISDSPTFCKDKNKLSNISSNLCISS